MKEDGPPVPVGVKVMLGAIRKIVVLVPLASTTNLRGEDAGSEIEAGKRGDHVE